MSQRCCRCPWRRGEEPLLPATTNPTDVDRRIDRKSAITPDSPLLRRLMSMTSVVKKTDKSALNTGLGAIAPSNPRSARESNFKWRSPAVLMLALGCSISLPSIVVIDFSLILSLQKSIFKPDVSAHAAGLAYLAAIPLACAAVNLVFQHIRQTTFWWESKTSRYYEWCHPVSRWLMLVTALVLLRYACITAVDESAATHIVFALDALVTVVLLSLYYRLLDAVDYMIKGMARDQEAINKTTPVARMQKIVRDITTHHKDEHDFVYRFAHATTVPAEVLAYIWWVYFILAKVLGAMIALAVFMRVDGTLVWNFLIGGVALSAAGSSGLIFELGPNALSVFRLALNRPFYVGDIVTLNSSGAMNSSTTSIMGFVENITMNYVVIRNFQMKQTWIPHKVFSTLVIQNWTRRPSKTVLLNIGVSSRCPVAKVERLTAFGKQWIQSSPEIQQQNYQKCHITKTANGYNIEIIFFPGIGVSHRGIRQKFLVAFMAAGERLQVPFVPLQIMQNFCEDAAAAPFGLAGVTLDDLLPDREARLPKGVDLQFRESSDSAPARLDMEMGEIG